MGTANYMHTTEQLINFVLESKQIVQWNNKTEKFLSDYLQESSIWQRIYTHWLYTFQTNGGKYGLFNNWYCVKQVILEGKG